MSIIQKLLMIQLFIMLMTGMLNTLLSSISNDKKALIEQETKIKLTIKKMNEIDT